MRRATDDANAHGNGESARNLVAFWLLGFVNNVGYVIMIAGAQEIAAGGVGLVYLFDIFPALLVKLTGPYWFHWISYRQRTVMAAVWMLCSFLVVAFGTDSLWLQLLGVAFSGLQSGMMEASFLAMTSFYEQRSCVTCWSSGTGLAGVGGYAWVAILHLWMGLDFTKTLVLASIFPVIYFGLFDLVLDTSHIPSSLQMHEYRTVGRAQGSFAPGDGGVCADGGEASVDEDLPAVKHRIRVEALTPEMDSMMKKAAMAEDLPMLLSVGDRFRFTRTLGPYMIPLIVVYFAEYTMQTGVWSTIGFPVTSPDARAQFYAAAGLAYQTGVFLSRSSGMLFQATRSVLYAMPVLQLMLLGFFTFVSATHVWYNWLLIAFCFVVGLLGGAVYVNAYTLLSKEVAASHVEFAMSAASVSDTFGIMLADFFGLLLQGCLYSINRIPGATIPISC